MLRSLASLCFGACLALGCTAPLTQDALRGQLERAGQSVPGLGRFGVVPIHADSSVAAWTLLAEAKADDSSLSLRLGHRFARGAKRRINLVVGGAYDDLTREVVLDALEHNRGASLRGLTLVYVGDRESARQVGSLAAELDARFHHRELP